MDDNKTNKLYHSIMDNLAFIIMFFLAIAYILSSAFVYSINDWKTAWKQILANGAIFLGISYIFTVLIGKQAITNATNSKKYLSSLNYYASKLEESDKYMEYIPSYCNWWNEVERSRKVRKYLNGNGISYEAYKKNAIEIELLSDKQKKALKKLDSLKFKQIDQMYLTSNVLDNEHSFFNKTYDTINEYERHALGRSVVTKFLTAIAMAFLVIDPNSTFDIKAMIFRLVQIMLILGMGSVNYMTKYFYVTETFRSEVIIVKTNHLTEFLQLIVSHPELFYIESYDGDKIYINEKENKENGNNGAKQSIQEISERTTTSTTKL